MLAFLRIISSCGFLLLWNIQIVPIIFLLINHLYYFVGSEIGFLTSKYEMHQDINDVGKKCFFFKIMCLPRTPFLLLCSGQKKCNWNNCIHLALNTKQTQQNMIASRFGIKSGISLTQLGTKAEWFNYRMDRNSLNCFFYRISTLVQKLVLKKSKLKTNLAK